MVDGNDNQRFFVLLYESPITLPSLSPLLSTLSSSLLSPNSNCYLLNLHHHRLKFQYCRHHCPYLLPMKLLCHAHLLHLILLLIYYLHHLCYHHVLQDRPQQTLRVSSDVLLQSKKKKKNIFTKENRIPERF